MQSRETFAALLLFSAALLSVYPLRSLRAEQIPSPAVSTPETEGASRAPAAIEDAVTRKLRAAVEESQSKLGELEPWQKKIFDEEAVPQYQRFIRDYRSSQTHSGTAISSLAVDIDMASLKNYLKFYAPKALGRTEKDSTIFVYLSSNESCEKCVAALPGLRKLAAARVIRRGFRPVWLVAEDLGTGKNFVGKALDDKVAMLASERNAAASLVIQWGPAPVDDLDAAHADEKSYVIHSVLQVKGISTFVGRSEGKLELLENDHFETAGARLLIDAFTDMGAQASKAEIAAGAAKSLLDSDQSEIALEISGIRDFTQMTKLKAQLQVKLSGAVIEERKVSRGRTVFAVVGAKSPEALRTQLNGLNLDPGRLVAFTPAAEASALSAPGSVSSAVQMEIRP